MPFKDHEVRRTYHAAYFAKWLTSRPGYRRKSNWKLRGLDVDFYVQSFGPRVCVVVRVAEPLQGSDSGRYAVACGAFCASRAQRDAGFEPATLEAQV